MKPPACPTPMDVNEEVSALIETLLESERRLVELTHGEVDTVAGRDGRTFLLSRAQEQLRLSDAARQSAILNALPAHIALIDTAGIIVSVNEAWRHFCDSNVLNSSTVGDNYLEVCDKAQGDDSSEGQTAAAGIRAVLGGSTKYFSLEYPCHSPEEQRWFIMTATPLPGEIPSGAVVMHLNITERKRVESSLIRLAAIVESSGDAIIGKDLNSIIISWNSGAERVFGYRTNEMVGTSILRLMPKELDQDDPHILEKVKRGENVEPFDTQRKTKDGRVIDISVMASPIKNASGAVIGVSIAARDITKFKKSREELQESEQRFAGAFEHAPNGMALVSTSGRWLKVNSALCQLLGYSEAEFLSSTFMDITHPEDIDRSLDFVRHSLAENSGSYNIEKRYLHKLGNFVTATVSISLIRDAKGLPLYFVIQIQDITERKRAEEALLKSEAEFRALAESMPQMVWVTRPDGCSIFFSQQWMDYTGLTLEESLGHGWNKPFHPDDQQRTWDAWAHATKTIGTYSVEVRLRRADGVYRWWLTRGVPQRDDAGNVLKWFGTCTDIHDLKIAELEISRTNGELRESEENFRQLAENIDEVFWIANPVDHKIIYVSPAFEKIWGRPCESLYHSQQIWLDTIHPDDREHVRREAMFKQINDDYDETYRILRSDGSIRWIHDRAFPIRNAAGEIFRVVGTAMDVTENRNLQTQFNQSQKMEAFGLLAGGVAHDFNNLMSVVMGYSDIWLMKLPPDSPIRAPLKAIRNAGQRATSLTKQLLAFSRQTVLESKVLDLNTVVQETEKMLERLIGEDIVLSSILDPAIPRIKVDPGQIGQVLMNLAINARDAMTRGGNLTLETRTVDLDDAYVQAHLGTKAGRHVMLSVSDTGTGMPPEVVARIFEPFFTTKGVGKGTGLGLAVVYGVISQSGGSIEVESDVGAGTTFKLYFPITQDEIHPAGKSGEIEIHAGIETILVVEDEASLLEIAKESLESFGYTVLMANSGPDALKLLSAREGKIDLLLTDVVMPGMSGRELADTVKMKLPELKVLFMSGYTDDSVVRYGVNHEKVAFLQKPFAPFDLLKKVREVLDKN